MCVLLLEMDVLNKNEDSVLLPKRTGDGNNAHRRNEEQTRRPFHADERFAVSKIMEDVHQLSDNLNPRITFLDFAGEHSHYAFHQIYLTHKTCYILVVDMTKEFDEKVRLPNSDEIHGSLFESWKYKGIEHTVLKVSIKLILNFTIGFLIKKKKIII